MELSKAEKYIFILQQKVHFIPGTYETLTSKSFTFFYSISFSVDVVQNVPTHCTVLSNKMLLS